MSLRQRGRVVDAIAGHGDDVSFLLQALHDLRLLVRQYFSFKIVDAQLTGDCFCSGAAIAGEHHNPNALRLELVDGLGSRWFDRVSDSDQAGRGTIDSYKDSCLPGAAEIIGFLGKFARGYTKFFKKLFVPSGNSLALHVSNNALARQITKATSIDKRKSILLRGRNDRGPQRVLTSPLQTCDQPDQFDVSLSRQSGNRHNFRLALGERARLIDYQRVHFFQDFEGFGILDQNTGGSPASCAHHDGHGGRESQRTWTCNDQHRHRIH